MVMEKPDARQRGIALAKLTTEQQFIIDIYLREKWEKLRHWQRNSGDNNIYIEYLNGIAYLEELINKEIEKINKREQRKQQSGNKK
jgi:hypothetical protein